MLGSSGKIEYFFTCTNKCPPEPSVMVIGSIDGLTAKEPTYNYDGQTLHASVRIISW